MARPEALLVVPVVPAAGGNGLAMRAGVLLEGLARAHDVRVLVVPVFGRGGPTDELVAAHAASITWASSEDTASSGAMIDALSSPAGRARLQALHPGPAASRGVGPATARAVAQAATGCRVVLTMRLYLAPALDDLLDRPHGPALVLDLDDLDWDRERSVGADEEAEAYERLAAWYLPQMSRLLAASEADAGTLTERTATPASVVPNGVRPPARVRRERPTHDLVFVGNLSYAPNVQGVLWFCREVLPRLPDATVAVVGSAPDDAVRALAACPRVTVAADVPEVDRWYACARAAVVPLHQGAGTRTKVPEAWAHRLPVISTSLGVRGLPSSGGVMIADSEADFAAGCRRVLTDVALADRLVAEGDLRLTAFATARVAIERVATALEDVRPR